jgi:phytanoyl-CoA hydroxylase
MSGQAQFEDPREALAVCGYAVIDDVISPEEWLDPVVSCLARVLDAEVRRLGGPGTSAEPADLERRLLSLVRSGATWPAQLLDISLPQGDVSSDTPMLLEPEVFALLCAPSLLDLVERLLGSTIWLSPVGHTRLKVPQSFKSTGGILGDVPWHQDNGVLLAEADDVDILTVWIPLFDATLETGCLQVHPTPRRASLLDHIVGSAGPAVTRPLVPTSAPVPLPMRRGSVLLMHSRTVHSSLPNRSADKVRLSLDLRYQAVEGPTGRPQFPAFLVRDAPGSSRRPAAFADWRQGWVATRDAAVGRSLGPFNRWDQPVAAATTG